MYICERGERKTESKTEIVGEKKKEKGESAIVKETG